MDSRPIASRLRPIQIATSVQWLASLVSVWLWAMVLQAHAACPPPHVEPSPEQVRAAQRTATDHGFLWEVSKAGRTSYLYGTIHIAKLEWVFPGLQLANAVRVSDTLALELNLLDEDTVKSIAREQTLLDDVKPPAEFSRWVAEQAQELCLNAADLEKVRPENQVIAITLARARMQGLEPEYGVDAVLIQAGKSLGKSIEALETAQDQLQALRSTPADLEDALAKGDFSPEESERGSRVLLQLATAWADNDLVTLESYPQWCKCMDSTADRQDMQRLVFDRNPKMAARIDALHAAGHNLMVAVGALHLIGANGLPTLLAQKGFVVKRVF